MKLMMPSQDEQGLQDKPALRVAFCAILTALSMLLSYIDSLIPVLPQVPGIKIGLANIVILLALYMLKGRYALAINIVRILLTGLLFTGVTGMMYSLSGALLSFLVMYVLKRTGVFSIIGVSLAGGAAHNTGQLLIAILLVSNPRLLYYLPVLVITGILTGVLTGFISHILIRRLKSILST